MPTLHPPGDPASLDPSASSGHGLGPFSGQALIAIEVVEVPQGGLEVLLQQVLAPAGPGQILEKEHGLKAFDRRELTVAGRPAVRLETMGDFGAVNHMLVVLDGARGFVLRGQGDGRVFDAVVGSLQLR